MVTSGVTVKIFSHIDQVTFSDLVQKAFDAEFDENFPENGSFLKQFRKNREYYYYKHYLKSGGDGPTKTSLKYVGPASDPEIVKRVENFERAKVGYRGRRELASKLRRSGYPAPPNLEGLVIAKLAKAGIFRLRATVVGSVAYQTYPGVLGVKLPDDLYATEDVIAKFYGISILIDEVMPDLEDVLKKADDTFAPSFSIDETNPYGGLINASGFKVEFITRNRGDKEYGSKLTAMPSLGSSVGAQALRFLDFLTDEPIRTVVLHDAGVPVIVPAPERYAVHKLIVATAQNKFYEDKAGKDIAQASSLIEAFAIVRRTADLGFAWMDAWDRGPKWRRRVGVGALRLADDIFAILEQGVIEAARLDRADAADYGVGNGKEGLLARLGNRTRTATPSP